MDLLFYPTTTPYPNPVDYANLTDELLLRDLWLTVPDYYEKKKVRKRLIEVRNGKIPQHANQKRSAASKGNVNTATTEAPRHRISRTGSFEEKLRRARMEASQPIEVPANYVRSTVISASISPDCRLGNIKKQFSSSLDTDDGQPPDFSIDSGNASGSDSEHQRKGLSSSDALTSDEGTSSEDEKIIKEYFKEDEVAKLDDSGFANEVLFPGSDKKITKVTAVQEDSTSPITIQVETRPQTEIGRTVFELLSSSPKSVSKATVPNSSTLISSLVRRSGGSPVVSRPNSGRYSYHFEDEDDLRSEFPDPEEIYNIDVLEEMLIEETEYEKRRQIRSRIRQLKRERGDASEAVLSPRSSPRHVKYAQISYIVEDGHELKPVPDMKVEVQRIAPYPSAQSVKNVSSGSPYKANNRDNRPRIIRKHRKFIKMDDDEYVNLDEITDEEELNELLEDTDDIDERKKIRTRLLEVKAEKRAKRESKFKKREDDREAALQKKARAAEEQKQRTMAMYDEAAKSAPAGANKSFNVETYASQGGSARSTPSRYVGEQKKDLVEDAIKNRMLEAENRKKRILAAYDHASKSAPAGAHKQVNFEAFKRADVTEFKAKALQPGSSTFGMSGGVPDMKGPFKANVVINEPAKSEPVELDATERAIRARVQEAEDHKRKLLAAYDMAAKDGGGPKQVVLSNYLHEVQVPSDNKLGVNHSSTGCFSGGIPFYNRPQDPLPVSPRDRFKKMDAKVANTPGNNTNAKPNFTVNKRMGVSGIKDAILNWCQSKTKEYENIKITNFSSCWANGLAFCALTHHFYPDAFDYYSLRPENRRHNLDLGFKAAEDFGGVCPLLETDDMIMMKDKPDWKCVFTYVQSLYQKYRNLE